MTTLKTAAGAGAAAFAVGLTTLFGGAAIANAAPKDQVKASAQAHKRADRITGEEAQKAIDAALLAVPGTADHAHKTADGNYLVKVKTSDGKTVIVTVDSSFQVVKTQERTEKQRGETVTDAERASAEAAAIAAVPGATVKHVHKLADGTYRVDVRTADGKRQVVKLDADFGLVSVSDANGKHRHGKRH